ncbi:MAG: Rrf2 family transcriptional regulator [Bryobacterales bacterium]|nr:Rrf2 family transcriptional regulator [Bryobacterales bacterium]
MLSITAEHALRALSEMAAIPEGELILGKELAASTGVPPNYLAKILWTLGNAGIIDAIRGSGGGYRLRRPPSEIRLREVVDLFDRHAWRKNFFLSCEQEQPGEQCEPCSVQAAWDRVRTEYLQFLESTTIGQIAEMQKRRDASRSASE